MRKRQVRKRPRASESRDARASPHSLLSKLPIAESLGDTHIPSIGRTRRQQRKIDRKEKRKNKRSRISHPHEADTATAQEDRTPPSEQDSLTVKRGIGEVLQSDKKAPKKRRKRDVQSGDVPKHAADSPVGTKQNVTSEAHVEQQGASQADENPDYLETRRLERLLGIRKRGGSSATSNLYKGIFEEEEEDLLNLVTSCDRSLGQNRPDGRPTNSEKGRSTVKTNGEGRDSHSSASQDDEDTDDQALPESSEEEEESGKYVAKWKQVRAARTANGMDTQPKPSLKAVQGVLNRISPSNTSQMAKKISSLYPKVASAKQQQAWANSYNDFVLEAINQGNSMGSTNPYLRAHVTVIYALGTTVDLNILATFVVKTITRLRNCIESDKASTSSETVSIQSRTFGYIVALCAAYEEGVLSSDFMSEVLKWIAGPHGHPRLEAELKFLQEAGPLLRKNDPATFVDVVKFVNSQSSPHQSSGDVDSSGEFACKMTMLTDLVESIRNNRIKVTATLPENGGEPSAYLPFQAKLANILDVEFTCGTWWLQNETGASGSEKDDDEQRAIGGEHDHMSSQLSKLAVALRLNTDSRRGLLAAVMTSASCAEALQRIERLGTFSSKQKLKDLTYIITNCCGAERPYNKFYALLAKQVCKKSREARFAMEFTIQDALKDKSSLDREGTPNRKISNIAYYLGDLWASEGLPLSLLRRIPDLEDISDGEQRFYIAVFERMISQRHTAGDSPPAPFVRLRMEKVNDIELFCTSLAVFLRRNLYPNMSTILQPHLSRAIDALEKDL